MAQNPPYSPEDADLNFPVRKGRNRLRRAVLTALLAPMMMVGAEVWASEPLPADVLDIHLDGGEIWLNDPTEDSVRIWGGPGQVFGALRNMAYLTNLNGTPVKQVAFVGQRDTMAAGDFYDVGGLMTKEALNQVRLHAGDGALVVLLSADSLPDLASPDSSGPGEVPEFEPLPIPPTPSPFPPDIDLFPPTAGGGGDDLFGDLDILRFVAPQAGSQIEILQDLAIPYLQTASQGVYWAGKLGHNVKSIVVVDGGLKVTPDMHVVVGGMQDTTTDANFVLKDAAALVFSRDWFEATTESALHFEAGSTGVFEKGSLILLVGGDKEDAKALLARSGYSLEGATLVSAEEGARVEGLEQVVIIVTDKSGTAHQLSLRPGASMDSWTLSDTVWRANGPFAAAINAASGLVMSGKAPAALSELFYQHGTPAEFTSFVSNLNYVQNGLGTTTELLQAGQYGVRAARRTQNAHELFFPLTVELWRGESRGRFSMQNIDGPDENRYERRTTGLRASLDMRYADKYAGLFAGYGDAKVGMQKPTLTGAAGMKLTSTLVSLGAYAGRGTDWGSLTGNVAFMGAEDKTRLRTAGDGVVGAERIQRRALMAGGTAMFKTDALQTLHPWLSVDVQGLWYAPVSYELNHSGRPIWDMKEDARWVGVLGLDAGFGHLYAFSRGYVKTEFVAGGSLRAGDIDVTQTMRAAGASASVKSPDIARAEARAALHVTVDWGGSTVGAGVEAAAGPNGARNLAWELALKWSW